MKSAKVAMPNLFRSLAQAQGALGEMVVVTEGDRVVYVNDAFCRVSGYRRDEVTRTGSVAAILTGPCLDLARAVRRRRARAGIAPSGTLTLTRKDGQRIPVTASVQRYRPGSRSFVVVARASEPVDGGAADASQPGEDAVTGLINRASLVDRVTQLLAEPRHQARPMGPGRETAATGVAMLVVAIADFGEVVETSGAQVGDRLLRQVATRLGSRLDLRATMARLHGPEFAILLPGSSVLDAESVARECLQQFERPFVVDDQVMETGASIGIAIHPDHGTDAAALLHAAGVAATVAHVSRPPLAVYSPENDVRDRGWRSRLAELRGAIDDGQLVVHYQPKLSLADGRVVGVEALARWEHPTRGLVPAGGFIGLAEQSGLITRITPWVLRTAAIQCREWLQAGLSLPVAVNLSTHDLRDPDLPAAISALLEESGLEAKFLEVEITESVLMSDPELAVRHVARLRAMGVSVAIDDFGTGYSSLAYLQRLRVDTLKIDRSFVSRMTTDTPSLEIVRATVDLAHTLGLRVVAEGIEDQATFEGLTTVSCDVAQGFHLGRPMAARMLASWAKARGDGRRRRGMQAAAGA